MNRSILLVICDFLLLSMLALARFDQPEEETVAETESASMDQAPPESEILELLELSLQEEQSIQRQLKEELEAKAQTLEETEAARKATESALSETKSALNETAATLQQRESALEEAQSLADERFVELSEAQQKAQELESSFQESEAVKAELEKTLSTAQLSSEVALERLRQTEASLAKAEAEKAALEAEKAKIDAERREVEKREQSLKTELRVAETERNLIAKNLENAQIQLETVQIEKQALQQQTERLSEGVSNLAQTSQEIRKEIQESQPQSPANIFSQFKDERVTLTWQATYSGMFGTRNRQFESDGILVESSQGTHIVFLTEETPFKADSQWTAPMNLKLQISGSNGFETAPVAVSFSATDPRIGIIPVALGRESSISFSKDPFRFDKAVLVRPENGYYGEAGYRLSPQSNLVLDLDSRILSGLFGDFNPSQGDFVFALTGNLAAMMINGDRAIRLESPSNSHSIPVNDSYKAEQAKSTMDQINGRISRLPSSLR
ncbi:MAG: hypothetical protein ACPGN3_01565 [Opitutales bacterium]